MSALSPTHCGGCDKKAGSLRLVGNEWLCRECRPGDKERSETRMKARDALERVYERSEAAGPAGRGVRLTPEETHYLRQFLEREIDALNEADAFFEAANVNGGGGAGEGRGLGHKPQ